MPSPEVLAVLADEVAEASETVKTALRDLVAASDESGFEEARERYHEQVQRISGVTEILNLSGLGCVCEFLKLNLAALKSGAANMSHHLSAFGYWPTLVMGYLRAPKEGVYARELAEHFQAAAWPKPLDVGAAAALEQELLALSEHPEEAEQGSPRQTEALPEDVSLEPAEDVNPVLLESFVTEGPLQAAQYSATIQSIVRGEGWAGAVDEARRLIHALKGAANTVGVRAVATLSHHVEDILEYLGDNAIIPKGDLAKLLVAVADCLETMFEALLGTEAPPPQALRVLQDVLDVANRIDCGEFDARSATVSAPTAGEQTDEPVTAASSAVAADATTASKTSDSPARIPQAAVPAKQAAPVEPAVKIEPKVRVAARAIDDMLRLSGELAISRAHIQERLQETLRILTELRERDNVLWQRASDLEGVVTTQGVAAGKRQAVAAAQGESYSAAFDPLELDEYGELHTHVHGFIETIADHQLLSGRALDALSTIGTALNQQTLLNNELHDLLMTSRMVGVATLEPRLQRTVRQAADKSGKLAALEVHGGDVMLDDQMVNALIDPLQHLLRNAVDHGLEPSKVRKELGKGETGIIALSFERDGNYLVIKCRDDGAGLDLFRIHSTALARGLVTEDQVLTETEMARLILRAGFSTSSEVTELSGRGVGLDIVNTSIAKLKGSIDIETKAGEGVTFVLRVPMSMGIAHCLLTETGGQTFAIPTENIDRIVFSGATNIQRMGRSWVYRAGKDTCPVHALTDLLHYEIANVFGEREDIRPVILVNHTDGKVAIVVDTVASGRDLVIKSLGRYMGDIRGVIGASILGNGSVVPILGLSDLLRMRRPREPGGVAPVTVAAGQPAPTAGAAADILVVDDSLSVRTALSIFLNDHGYHVRTAKDGVEAIEEIDKQMPAVLLLDLEMPRMNGLELTSTIRARSEIAHLPVIMITSRTSEKHRIQAHAVGVDHYVTKPYRESDLLSLLQSALSKAA